ncbi:caspase family protein [Roseibium sp.]|uniref:caspase family protein n=1 Tax=Roseibium sp. TaxID=1936156 RepID=UPI003BAA6718
MGTPKKIAALFGNQIYTTDQSKLNFVPHDVVTMANVLELNSWELANILINYDQVAGSEAIDELQDYISTSSENWDVLIYYAGHGKSDGQGYWTPSKRSDSDLDFDIIDYAVELVCKPRVQRLTLILDACESARISVEKVTAKIGLATEESFEAGELIILAANWNEAHESSHSKGGYFTLALSDFLKKADNFPSTWAKLRDYLQKSPRLEKCSLLAFPVESLDKPIPFSPAGQLWPGSLGKQMRFLLKNADPCMAFGALFGASRIDKALREEVHVAPPEVLETAKKFSLSNRFLEANEGKIDWSYLDRMTLAVASPFHAVTDLSDDVSAALTVALAKLLYLDLNEETPAEEARADAESIDHLKAQKIASMFEVTVEEFSRLSNRVRVLIVHTKLKRKDTNEVKAFAFRFLRIGENIEVHNGPAVSSRFERAAKELNGIEVAKFFSCIGNYTAIESEQHKHAIGVAYELLINGTRAQSLTPFLTECFADPEPEKLKTAAKTIQKILTELFGKLGTKPSSWKFSDGKAMPGKLSDVDTGSELSNILDALQNMGNTKFSGELKTNSLQTELRFIEHFLRNIVFEATTEGVKTICGIVHGDMHQKNIVVQRHSVDSDEDQSDANNQRRREIKNLSDVVSLIDFENSSKSDLAFLDMASLEVSLVVFFLEDYVGFDKITRIITRIESEWLSEDIKLEPATNDGPREVDEIILNASGQPDLDAYSENRVFPDYNAYEGVAHSVIGAMRLILRAAIYKFYNSNNDGIELTDQRLKAHLRQYYVLLFLSTVRLITVASAPKAVVINYAFWLANQLRTDSDLVFEMKESEEKTG